MVEVDVDLSRLDSLKVEFEVLLVLKGPAPSGWSSKGWISGEAVSLDDSPGGSTW